MTESGHIFNEDLREMHRKWEQKARRDLMLSNARNMACALALALLFVILVCWFVPRAIRLFV